MQPPSDCPIPNARGYQAAPEGTGALRTLILGEALGDSEAIDGLPFRPYAPAGSLLERAITRCGYSREQFAVWNVVPTQPPHNYLEGAPYEAAAVEWGRPKLEAVIRDYNIGAILALGNIPLRATTGMCGEYRSISHLQNWVLPSRWPGVAVVPALHPAFIRRGALPLFSVLMHGLKLAVAWGNGAISQRTSFFSPVLWRDFTLGPCTVPDLSSPVVPSGYVCYPNESAAFEFLREVEEHPNALVAYDIETPRSTSATENDSDELEDTEILSIQFSLARGTGIFMPWREGYTEAARAILALPNPKAGANTWRFDDPLLEAHGAHLNGVRHDVRWCWKHLQPDLRAPLQLIASFYCVGQPGWTCWKQLHASHPEFYGIRDVDAIQYILSS